MCANKLKIQIEEKQMRHAKAAIESRRAAVESRRAAVESRRAEDKELAQNFIFKKKRYANELKIQIEEKQMRDAAAAAKSRRAEEKEMANILLSESPYGKAGPLCV